MAICAPKVGQQTVVMPGFDGGAEWGGQAADPQRGILYLNANDIAGPAPAPPPAVHSLGGLTYQRIAPCAMALTAGHAGLPLAGRSGEVSFAGPDRRHGASRRRPHAGLTQLQGDTLKALIQYLETGNDVGAAAAKEPQGAADAHTSSPAIASSWIPMVTPRSRRPGAR